jgi:DNA processing protein
MARISLDQDRLDRLRLIRSSRIGPVTYHQLLDRFGSAAEALHAIPDLAKRGGGARPKLAETSDVEREVARVEQLGAAYIFSHEASYSALLREIDNPPAVMTYRGDLSLLERRCIAMVGARNASAAACRFARQLAQDLGRSGGVVVSGLARGVDTAAHIGALAGGTIGVIASGIDIAFPNENKSLQEEVACQGLLLAEQPPGAEPLARNFPYRNRVIAGVSLGTVVVEAAPRSGSLITARLAGEAGREVMAVPGSPLDPRAQGCNLLIRDGAILVQNAADVMEAIAPLDGRMLRQPSHGFSASPATVDVAEHDRGAIHALLSPVPVPVDELIRQSGLAPGIVQTILLELELARRLSRHAGGRIALT